MVSPESKHAFDFFHHPKVAQQRCFQVPFGLLSCTSHHRRSPYSEYHALLQGRAAVDGFPFSCTKRRRGIGALAATAMAAATRAHSEAEQAAFECKLASVVFISSAAAELCASLQRHSGRLCMISSKKYKFFFPSKSVKYV